MRNGGGQGGISKTKNQNLEGFRITENQNLEGFWDFSINSQSCWGKNPSTNPHQAIVFVPICIIATV